MHVATTRVVGEVTHSQTCKGKSTLSKLKTYTANLFWRIGSRCGCVGARLMRCANCSALLLPTRMRFAAFKSRIKCLLAEAVFLIFKLPTIWRGLSEHQIQMNQNSSNIFGWKRGLCVCVCVCVGGDVCGQDCPSVDDQTLVRKC